MVRIAGRRALVIVVAALLGACSGVASRGTLDSAGVHIVEHAPIRNPPVAFRLAPKPTLDLGGLHDDPNYEFNPRSPFLQGVRLSDGGMVVADEPRLKFFDATGKFVKAVGRGGKGPGEFRQISHLCLGRGDTVIAIGYGDRRTAVYDKAGTLALATTLPGDIWGQPCFPDGTLLANMGTVPDPARGTPGPEDRMNPFARFARIRVDGTIVNEVGVFPQEPIALAIERPVSVLAHGDFVTVGDGKTWEYRQYTANGKLTRIVRVNDPPLPVSEADLERELQSRIPREVTGEARMQAIERTRRLGAPPTYPSYSQMLVDAADRVWVRDYYRVEPNGWTVFDAAGQLLGRFMLPSDSTIVRPEIVQIGRGEMMVRWRDGDGAPHLGIFPLVPPE